MYQLPNTRPRSPPVKNTGANSPTGNGSVMDNIVATNL